MPITHYKSIKHTKSHNFMHILGYHGTCEYEYSHKKTIRHSILSPCESKEA